MTAEDLTFRESTATSQAGFTWVRKEYRFSAVPSTAGELWFAIGVWGTSEFARTYYIDNVELEAVRGS